MGYNSINCKIKMKGEHMKNNILKVSLILTLIVSLLIGCAPLATDLTIDEEGIYTSPEDLAEYIHLYDKLPSNYIRKNQARDLGWVSNEGNLWDVTEEMSIGGDSFGNREGLLPDKDGRKYYEADVNYEGGYRGAERIVYSNDGLIFYTDDHYNSFEQLY